ncbi:GMC oxidoreductase [Streptomyces sp. NPDC060035]|uniref:GMC oxidoreductase n=1 Tax=Streptomyces sp. NPDC060035 TaxID=3347044 RepID=UPI0036C1CB3D
MWRAPAASNESGRPRPPRVGPTQAARTATAIGRRPNPPQGAAHAHSQQARPTYRCCPVPQPSASGLGTVTDTNALVNSTWHPLGGAPMGTVCDLEGRVQGQRGLYVLDGAPIPGTAGACNPSMTIAAVAERALDAITAHDIDTII